MIFICLWIGIGNTPKLIPTNLNLYLYIMTHQFTKLASQLNSAVVKVGKIKQSIIDLQLPLEMDREQAKDLLSPLKLDNRRVNELLLIAGFSPVRQRAEKPLSDELLDALREMMTAFDVKSCEIARHVRAIQASEKE